MNQLHLKTQHLKKTNEDRTAEILNYMPNILAVLPDVYQEKLLLLSPQQNSADKEGDQNCLDLKGCEQLFDVTKLLSRYTGFPLFYRVYEGKYKNIFKQIKRKENVFYFLLNFNKKIKIIRNCKNI